MANDPGSLPFIPLSVPVIQGNEWRYVKECLDTGWVSSVGSYVNRFEEDLAAFVGAPHAIACVNGTAALQIALQLAGVVAGEEVIAPTVTFIATINAVRYAGADPVFMDCDRYYNLDIEKVLDFLKRCTVFRDGHTWNKRTNRRIAALMPVHVFGNAVDLPPLLEVCRKLNIRVVEDAAESLGTYYTQGPLAGKHTGTVGDVGCFSFNGNKIVTCGGGGMIVTADAALAERARYLTTQAKDDAVRFVHHEVGYNYRLTNMQAALGVAQLEQVRKFIASKKRNFLLYRAGISGVPGLSLAESPPYADCNLWLYCLQIRKEDYGADREALMAYLEKMGVQSRPIWHLNHLQKPYARCESYHIEAAYTLYDRTLNLPSSSNLTEDDIERIVGYLVRSPALG